MAPTPLAPPLPGDTLGPYRLIEPIGVGGMATVYKASSPRHGLAAVKILHPGKAETDEERRFRREFLTLKELHHPGIVRVYEYGRHGAYPWIAMELVEGTDLGTLLEQWRAQPPPDRFVAAERILRGLCEALAYVHDRGLIHRDLKPGNILITAEGKAKLTDFGVVKSQGGIYSTKLTMAGRLVGTIAFMAPEQIMAEAIDARADLYSLGAVLYLLLTGERPIIADNIAGYLSRHLTQDPRPPSEIDPRVPPRLERIAMRLLRKDAAQRYPNARQVLVALDADERSQRPAVVGRHTEIAQLLARLETLRTGGGGLVLIQGEAGSGRSALCQELVDTARAAGFDLAYAQARTPLPLDQLAAQTPTGLGVEAAPAIARLALRVRARPWTLVIDDWDELPPADAAALTRLVREAVGVEGDPLLLIASLRRLDGPIAAFASGAATGISPEILRLPLLDRKATIAVVRDQGLTGAAGLVLGGRLFEELGGNPGAVVAQIATLVEAGWLAPEANGALRPLRTIDALRSDPLPVPVARRDREAARLAPFDPDVRRVYNALVVLGVEVTADLLADTAGLDVGTIEHALTLLLGAQLVTQRVEGVSELYAIERPAAQDLFASFIDPAEQIALHRAAASALKRRSRRRAGAANDLIAEHLLAGDLPAEALPLLLDGARRRLRADRVDQAQRLLLRADEAALRAQLPPEEARRHNALRWALHGEAEERNGELSAALSSWERALACASESGDADAVARARAGIGLVRASLGEGAASIGALEAASRTLPPGDPLWPRVTEALATARMSSGELAAAEGLYRRLEGLGRDTGSAQILAKGILGRALVARCTGDVPGARALLESVEDRLREGGASGPLGSVLAVVADLALADGRLADAHDHGAEAERIFRQQEWPVPLIHALAVRAEIHQRRSQGGQARQLAREAAGQLRALGEAPTGALLIAQLRVARALCHGGLAEEALALVRDLPDPDRPALEDPVAQQAAARAQALLLVEPPRAAELAVQVVYRPPAPLPVPAARAALDAAAVLVTLEDPRAADAVREALLRTTLPGMRLLRRDALDLALRTERRPAWVAEARALESELRAELAPSQSDLR